MKIAVTSTGKDLSSNIEPSFGRAPYLILVDPDTMDWEVVDNLGNAKLSHGAGIQAGKTVADKGVNVLITARVGPKADQVLNQAGIKMITDVGGRVDDAVRQFKEGELD